MSQIVKVIAVSGALAAVVGVGYAIVRQVREAQGTCK